MQAVGYVGETAFRETECQAVSWDAFRISSKIKKAFLFFFFLFNEFSHP